MEELMYEEENKPQEKGHITDKVMFPPYYVEQKGLEDQAAALLIENLFVKDKERRTEKSSRRWPAGRAPVWGCAG